MGKFRILLLFVLIIVCGILVITKYSYFFSKRVVGEIVDVKQIEQPNIIMGGSTNIPNAYIRSFAVAVKFGDSGEIYTASTEDRQWAVAQKGQCAIADFYPYPPWNLEKKGTYHNARLVMLCETCASAKCAEELNKAKEKL